MPRLYVRVGMLRADSIACCVAFQGGGVPGSDLRSPGQCRRMGLGLPCPLGTVERLLVRFRHGTVGIQHACMHASQCFLSCAGVCTRGSSEGQSKWQGRAQICGNPTSVRIGPAVNSGRRRACSTSTNRGFNFNFNGDPGRWRAARWRAARWGWCHRRKWRSSGAVSTTRPCCTLAAQVRDTVLRGGRWG